MSYNLDFDATNSAEFWGKSDEFSFSAPMDGLFLIDGKEHRLAKGEMLNIEASDGKWEIKNTNTSK